MTPSRLPLALTLVVALALTLSACGRRGPLEAPPTAAAQAAAASGQPAAGQPIPEVAEADNDALTVSPIGTAKPRPAPAIIPNRPFILDSLL